MKIITLTEVKHIAHSLAKVFMESNEPIPPFETRFPRILESCLAVPFQKFNNKYLYSGLISKAAILFYLMIKNHPFQNGNKRIAMTSLLVFLYKNNKWIEVDNQALYNFAIWVTTSPSELKTEVIKSIEKFLKSHLVNIK